MLWTVDVRRGAIFLGAFVLPFGLLAIGFARLPWRGRWLTWLWGGLVATALAYAAVGGYQWLTRDVFWNPSVKVFNAYAPFFRVNSVFWDPSVYGRYLTVAILASLAGILLGGIRGWRVAGLYAVVCATWLGLLISFSQSSFVALAVGIVVAAAVAWGRRATLALVALGAVTVVVLARRPADPPRARRQVALRAQPDHVGPREPRRRRASGSRATTRCRASASAASRASTPAGSGSRAGTRSASPRTRRRSRSLAEEGFVGLALLAWLVAAAFLATLRGLGRGFTSRVSLATGIVLLAIAVHSVFYAAFFEDPMTWALLGLVGLVSRVPKKSRRSAPAGSLPPSRRRCPSRHRAP